jgi:hypothetical protein
MLSGCSRESAAPTAPAASAQDSRDIETVVADYCGGCHLPPRPQGHAPAAWPAVVARMQEHRRRAGLSAIPTQDLDRIVNYLQDSGGET